ncbi:MAG: hypothetical protein KDB27_33775 [Planctomycetales bacterium]|nr:hypothetical protein [Planctomycetales bacterium]
MESNDKHELGLGCIFPIMRLPFVISIHYYIIGNLLVSVTTNSFPYVYATDAEFENFVRTDSERTRHLRIRVNYHYYVGDQKYTGNQFRFGVGRTREASPSWKDPEEFPLKVFYNPACPKESALPQGLHLERAYRSSFSLPSMERF